MKTLLVCIVTTSSIFSQKISKQSTISKPIALSRVGSSVKVVKPFFRKINLAFYLRKIIFPVYSNDSLLVGRLLRTIVVNVKKYLKTRSYTRSAHKYYKRLSVVTIKKICKNGSITGYVDFTLTRKKVWQKYSPEILTFNVERGPLKSFKQIRLSLRIENIKEIHCVYCNTFYAKATMEKFSLNVFFTGSISFYSKKNATLESTVLLLGYLQRAFKAHSGYRKPEEGFVPAVTFTIKEAPVAYFFRSKPVFSRIKKDLSVVCNAKFS